MKTGMGNEAWDKQADEVAGKSRKEQAQDPIQKRENDRRIARKEWQSH